MTGKKILIIDDDTKNIFALEATLRAKGFQYISAVSANEGIALLQKDPGIGIVLLDMMMPGMDGYETLAMIRQYEEFSSLPVIAVTAQAMTGDREKCINAGADGYLSKPSNVDRLFDILYQYLS